MVERGRSLALALALCGCTRGAPAPLPPGPAAGSAPIAAAVAPPAAAPVPAPDAGSIAAPAGRRLQITVERVVQDLEPSSDEPRIDDACDFNRLYRGAIGSTPVSVRLTRANEGAPVGGEVHYDVAGPGLAIERATVSGASGSGATLRFDERGGGRFELECDAVAAELTGRYTLKGKSQAVKLGARPAAWPGLHRVRRSKVVTGAGGRCDAEERALRVFGLAPAVTSAANRGLAASGFDGDVREIAGCAAPMSLSRSMTTIVDAFDDVLTLQGMVSGDYGGAHPMNAVAGGTSIDLRTGRVVALGDVLAKPEVLRRLLSTCLRDYYAVEGTEKDAIIDQPDTTPATCDYPGNLFCWDCDGGGTKGTVSPKWALTRDGIAVLASGHAHVEAFRDAFGPIVSWAALKRDGALPARSPLSRLWQHVTPAAAADPACTSATVGRHFLRWSVRSSP